MHENNSYWCLNMALLNLSIESEAIMENYRCSISDFDEIKKLPDLLIQRLIFNINFCDHTRMRVNKLTEYSVIIPEKIDWQNEKELLNDYDLLW